MGVGAHESGQSLLICITFWVSTVGFEQLTCAPSRTTYIWDRSSRWYDASTLPASIHVVSESGKMAGRWSGARQGVIETARAVIASKACTYGISGLEGEDRVVAVRKLLDDESFHFGKATSVSNFPDSVNQPATLTSLYYPIHRVPTPQTGPPHINTPKL